MNFRERSCLHSGNKTSTSGLWEYSVDVKTLSTVDWPSTVTSKTFEIPPSGLLRSSYLCRNSFFAERGSSLLGDVPGNLFQPMVGRLESICWQCSPLHCCPGLLFHFSLPNASESIVALGGVCLCSTKLFRSFVTMSEMITAEASLVFSFLYESNKTNSQMKIMFK